MACGNEVTLTRDNNKQPFYLGDVVDARVLNFENDVYILEQTQYESTNFLGCYFDAGASEFKIVQLPGSEAVSLTDLSASDFEKYLDMITSSGANESGFLNENLIESKRMLAWSDAPAVNSADPAAITVSWDEDSIANTEFSLVRSTTSTYEGAAATSIDFQTLCVSSGASASQADFALNAGTSKYECTI
jgi:hypothetical protein